MPCHEFNRNIECLSDWLSKLHYADMYAVTFTMKQSNGGFKLDDASASQNLRHFLNIVNQTAFGNSYRRFGKRVKVIPVIETSAWDRLHYHLSIEKPEHLTEEEFLHLIGSAWRRTSLSRKELDIRKIYSDGWLKYCLKSRDPLQAIDFENLNFD